MRVESAVRLSGLEKPAIAAMLRTARQCAAAGDAGEAERTFQRILESEPNHVEALYRLAMLLHEAKGRSQEALPLLDRAIALQQTNPALHTARGLVLNALGRPLSALDCLGDACCLMPDNLNALYNVALICAELCCAAQTEVIARHLLQKRPEWVAAHYLLVRSLTALETDAEKLDARYAFLIKSDPLNVALRFARGLLQLKMGNFASGWDAQEWRWEIEPVRSSRMECAQPRWAGSPIGGRTMLIQGEQGFGDMLQFVRYLPHIAEQGARVILRLDANRAPLARLLRRMEGVEISVEPERLPAFDLYCPLASLPYVFDTTIDTIPAQPYLEVDAQDVAAWREKLAALPRPWTGICWAGSQEHSHDIRRSLPLCENSRYHVERLRREERIDAIARRVGKAIELPALAEAAKRDAAPAAYTMEALLRRTPGSFISLQIGPRAGDIDDLPSELRSRFFAPLAQDADFYDTACLIQALDEVVTVDTSVAHLTGALGQRGLVFKPAAPEWRWIERDGKSVWYPSLTLAEQHEIAVERRERRGRKR